MAEDTKPARRRRTASGPPKDVEGNPVTGVPGTEDGPPNNWRGEHGHVHVDATTEHQHPDGQDDEEMDAQHVALDSYDQGPEANRAMEPEGPPTPEETEPGEEIARPIAGRSSTGESPQAAFGDVVIDVEAEDGEKLLRLFELRKANQASYRAFGAADRDIKKIMAGLGHYNGNPINVRVGGHLFSLVATSDDKEIELHTRHGSQRKSITHPAE
ncbi:MAG: hypothetical protein V3S68_00895 [Dehalococcoidia bacterium]